MAKLQTNNLCVFYSASLGRSLDISCIGLILLDRSVTICIQITF